jgi:hypothetical protein
MASKKPKLAGGEPSNESTGGIDVQISRLIDAKSMRKST